MLRRHLLGWMVAVLFLAPAWSMLLVQAQGGNITNFSSGLAEETVTITSGQHSAVGVELQRNTTITSATFFLKPDSSSASPGSVELDINQDGQPEWSFNQTGYGGFGHQTEFMSGNTTESIPIFPNTGAVTNPDSPSFYLPTGSTTSTASMDVSFSPTLTGGFFQTGFIDKATTGDINGDATDDFVLFSRSANLTASNNSSVITTGTGFRVVSYNASTGITFSAWTPTCANATRLMVADVNGDGYDDVINYAPSNDLLCIHFANNTGQGFAPQINTTHPSSVIDLDFADFTGNGAAEMVSIRTNGVVSIDEFSNRSNTFSNRDDTTVYQSGSQMKETFTHMLLDGFNGTSNPPILLACSQQNTAHQLFWSTSSGLVTSTSTISSVSSNAIAGDFDADGDLDILSPLATGYRTIENRGPLGWDGEGHSGILDLTNATIVDYDKDMAAHILFPNTGTSDGNPATVEGNFTAYGFRTGWNGDNEIRPSIHALLEPWTAPRALQLGDLDGDGFDEHLVMAGEANQYGVFISAWHSIGYDMDKNGDVDLSAQGYAGNGSYGLPMLSVQDINGNLSSTINMMSSGWNYTSDSYGIQMSEVNVSMSSMTAGTFVFDNLDVNYVADFLVNINPHVTGNLSNALNQQMTAGNGALAVNFTFTTSQNGTVILHTPSIAYQPGAPNIALPPTPLPQLVDAQPNRIVIEWQEITAFGDDLLDFFVYRAPSGQAVDIQNVYDQTFLNSTIDTNVQPGQSWTYWVRSVHNFGVSSNLSAPLQVSVPYPTPKSFIPNVSAADVPNDDGGVLSVSWTAGDPSVVEHRVYLSSSNFSTIEEMTATAITNATTLTVDIESDSAGAELVDGEPYYVAVVGYDSFGNASQAVSPAGPVYTRNDTSLTTNLDVIYTGFAVEESVEQVLLARQGGLNVHAHLHQDGRNISNADLVLQILGDDEEFQIPMETNISGHAVWDIEKLSDLGPIEALGPMTLKVSFAGDAGTELLRPLGPTSDMTDAYGTVQLTVTSEADVIDLDDTKRFDTVFTVSATEANQQNVLANLVVEWTANNADGIMQTNGTAEVRGNELAVSGEGVYDGHLRLHLPTDMPVYYLPGMGSSFHFEAAPVVANETNETNETNTTQEPTFPDITLPSTVDCGTATYPWVDNGTDEAILCTITNPNSFDVLVGFSWKLIPTTPPPFTFEFSSLTGSVADLTISAEGSTQVEFLPVRNGPSDGLFPGIQGVGYVVSLSCTELSEANQCDSMTTPTASTEGELQWTLGEMPVDPITPAVIEDDAAGKMTPVLVGIGVIIALVAAIVGVLYMRQSMDEEFDDDDDEDYYGQALDMPESTPRSVDLGGSKSLDELKGSGKELHEAAPEGVASSPGLGSKADAFQFGATAEDTVSTEEESADDEAYDTYEEEAHEEEESDDGITVDENGTEWWEDEEGVWWYREEGWEDWAAWED